MARRTYKIFEVLVREDPEDGGYNASCLALPGCHSQGATFEEACANIKEAIEAYLESLQKDGLPVPREPRLVKVKVAA